MKDFLAFKVEVKAKQVETGITYKDIVRITKQNKENKGKGYAEGTIEKFMCGAYGCSEKKIAKAIARALDIPEHMVT